jgi:hypothetical protein
MGRFKCHNPACSTNKWVSGHVAITIRMYPENEYNARVYHQRCQRCNFVSKPTLDYTYADRVTYRLKKWSGLQLEKPVFTDKKTPPHKSDLCEGCKAGHCLKASQLDVRDQGKMISSLLSLDTSVGLRCSMFTLVRTANSSTPLPHLDRRAMAIISKHYFG